MYTEVSQYLTNNKQPLHLQWLFGKKLFFSVIDGSAQRLLETFGMLENILEKANTL